MLKLPSKTNDLLLRFFAKPHLMEFFTNYDSFIFNIYKIGLIHTLLFRFFKICFSMEICYIEVGLLRSIFKCNNYHVNIISQCIKKFLDTLCVPKQAVATVPIRELLVVLLFLGTFCLNLIKTLHKLVSKSLPQ